MAVLLNSVIVYSSYTSQNVLVVLINFHLSKYVYFIILITAFYFVHGCCVLCVPYSQKCCLKNFYHSLVYSHDLSLDVEKDNMTCTRLVEQEVPPRPEHMSSPTSFFCRVPVVRSSILYSVS